jgi:selenocysteine lyase/cysteine desulfurase
VALCPPWRRVLLPQRFASRLPPAIHRLAREANPSLFTSASLQLAATARRLELGTLAYGAALALAAGIRYLDRLGFPRIERHAVCLSDALRVGLTGLGADILTPADAKRRASIVAARFKSEDSARLVKRLRERGIVVSARHGAVRFSVHVFNDLEDIRRALDGLYEETTRRASA